MKANSKIPNHEAWQVCPKCGNVHDLRTDFTCPFCKIHTKPN